MKIRGWSGPTFVRGKSQKHPCNINRGFSNGRKTDSKISTNNQARTSHYETWVRARESSKRIRDWTGSNVVDRQTFWKGGLLLMVDGRKGGGGGTRDKVEWETQLFVESVQAGPQCWRNWPGTPRGSNIFVNMYRFARIRTPYSENFDFALLADVGTNYPWELGLIDPKKVHGQTMLWTQRMLSCRRLKTDAADLVICRWLRQTNF